MELYTLLYNKKRRSDFVIHHWGGISSCRRVGGSLRNFCARFLYIAVLTHLYQQFPNQQMHCSLLRGKFAEWSSIPPLPVA
ncbi:hypothetical protein T02_14784 [Trichinella nativa]|uniref:Uncharacterized protein n=1 Tax=Trichinella nativa TaxID=6335 RepID=A0A0V1LPT1_9BILA|nr:hypothetical protein T02_14784 [Trichinella nativa]